MTNEKLQNQANSKGLNRTSRLADSENRYRTLIDNIPGVVYRCSLDEHWTMEFISDAIYTITGFNADDFINNRIRSYSSIIHPDDVQMVDTKVRAAVEVMEPFVLHYRIIDAQKEIKWVYEKGRASYDKENVPQWLDGVIFDYTEQYRAMQTLETEYAQLLSIFDNMDEVIYIADPQNYTLLYGNEVFRRNWGNQVGEKCYRALQGRDKPCPFCTNDKIFGENLGKTYIWEFQNEINHRWFRCIDRAIKWTDGSMVRFEMAIDNHELKMAQIELEEHRKHLEGLVEKRTLQLDIAKKQAELANAAKSDFLARMSHEIRTPLNAVTGLTNIVLKSDLSTMQRSYLNKVQLAGENLLQVINDILDFSKVEAGRLELSHTPFNLDRTMEKLADLFSEQVVHKDLELIFAVAPTLPRQLVGDSDRLTQILTNLVANAVKFTVSGEIVVAVEMNDMEDPSHEEVMLKFRISDTGIGISADKLPHIFDAFTQADSNLTRKHKGTGLGLAICRRLVNLMEGRIWAESTLGRGSTFSFTVKMQQQKDEKTSLCLPKDLHGLKTLVVDDSATARLVLVDLLESFSFKVTAVDSGAKAIEVLQLAAQNEPFQIVLLDWKMPGMDGIETAQAIRELEHLRAEATNQKPQIPIIIMVTAFGFELMHEHIDTSAVDTSLFKPIKASLLLNTIMDLLSKTETTTLLHDQDLAVQPPHGLSGHRILVVEDSALNRDVAVALLEEAGLLVDTAENGRIAVDKVAESPKGYHDAVLMDVQMPVMDGYQATKKIRELERHHEISADHDTTRLPIIALTAHVLKGEREKCLAADMDDYLTKPLDEQDLYRMLFKWISSTPKKRI